MLKENIKSNFIKEIAQSINLLNEELKVIDVEILIQKTKLDILAIDNIGKLIVIEIAEKEDDALIFKALDHFDWVLHNVEALNKKYQSFNIDYTTAPEIILISDVFSEDFQRRVSYLSKAKVHLYQYVYKKNNPPVLEFTPIKFEVKKTDTGDLRDNKTPEQIINLIKIEKVKDKCRKCLVFIKQLKENIKVDTSKGVIQFNDEGGNFAGIYPHGRFFWINFNPDYWCGKKIDEVTNLDLDNIIKNI